MIVCHCAVVSDRAVRDAVDRGAGSLGQVCRATGASMDCGACVFSVKRLLVDESTSTPVTEMEMEVAAS
jgi:bacterioferritin-associated ferredoxin